MRPHIISILFSFLAISAAASVKKAELDMAMRDLNSELERRNEYIERRQAHIDSLKAMISPAVEGIRRLELLREIAGYYKSFNNDSALHYFSEGFDLALALGNETESNLFKLHRAMYLPLAGFSQDAVTQLNELAQTSLPREMPQEYHEAARQMYSYIASSFTKYPATYNYWNDKANAHRDSLLLALPINAPLYALYYGEKMMNEGNTAKARNVLSTLLKQAKPDSNIYARAAHMLSSLANANDDIDEQQYYLALSAAADIRGAVREVMSLQELGIIFSEKGDINRAYDYLTLALTNAVECGAEMRINQSSTALPIIQKAHNEQMKSWRMRINWFIGLLAIVMLVLVAVMFKLHRQMKAMGRLQKHLKDSNQIKEVYISQFFRLCSIYIDRLNQFCQVANRKISAGQVDELYKMTKSGKIIEEQSHEFYNLFDDAFLHIYPTFVKDVNALLRDKITLKDNEKLNNELRILAFMRLGLDDTNQVALILNYSVNTIYAYRNKLRNRAYERETFERDVMNIGVI